MVLKTKTNQKTQNKKMAKSLQPAKSIITKWKFREAEKDSKFLIRAYDTYIHEKACVAIINASFDEAFNHLQENPKYGDFNYEPKIISYNFNNNDKILNIGDSKYNRNLVKRFFKSEKRVIITGTNCPLLIESKPNWTVIIAPIIDIE